jgi:hypothetical protein
MVSPRRVNKAAMDTDVTSVNPVLHPFLGIISYYLAQILTSIGITDATQQAGLNGGLQIW